MQFTSLRPAVAIVWRIGRLQIRTFYRTLSMAFGVTATHQQTRDGSVSQSAARVAICETGDHQ